MNASTNPKARAIIILGMHRSGTSAVARVCNLLGADIGVHLMPPREGNNPTGFWEIKEIVDIHDELLASLDSSWHDTNQLPNEWWKRPAIKSYKNRLIEVARREFTDSALLCLKDPRMCRLMPLWEEIFRALEWAPHYLLIIRNPLEVAKSLESRDNLHHCVSYLLWLRHVLEAESFTRDARRAFVGYEDLLTDWRGIMASAWTRLGLGDLHIDAATAASIDGFIHTDLRHHAAELDELEDDDRHALILATYKNCSSAMRQDTTQLRNVFSELGDALINAASLYEPIVADERNKGVRLKEALSALDAHNKRLEDQRKGLEDHGKRLEDHITRLEDHSKRLEDHGKRLEDHIKRLEQNVSTATSSIEKLEKELALASQEAQSRLAEVNSLGQAVTDRNATIASLLSSTSWRLTKPLRAIISAARGVRGGLRAVSIRCLRRLFDSLPINDHNKLKLRWYVARNAGALVGFQAGAGRTFDDSYDNWIAQYDTLNDSDRAAITRHITLLPARPLISVIMPVFNTPERFLTAAIQSVLDQLYDRWELCIADDGSTEPHVARIIREYQEKDGRIKAVFREKNGNISACSNSALPLANGEFLALMDHDDVLAEHALYEIALAIDDNPHADIIYSDEDKIDEHDRRSGPNFKSDWNLDLFYGQNMLNHLSVYKAAIVKELGGFRTGFEGSQDYDLALRVVERTCAKNIVHVPHVLYHWRATTSAQSFSQNQLPRAVMAARRAVTEHLERIGVDASVSPARNAEHYQRVRRFVLKPEPLVSLIVPTRDKVSLLRQCIDGILTKTDYPALEIIIVDNGSTEPETKTYFREIQADSRVRVIEYELEFNYSAINNFAMRQAKGDVIGLINNDIVVINDEWLTEMVSHAMRPEVGAVGAALYYPDDTVQHAGIITGIGGVAGHGHKHFRRDDTGYFGRLKLTQNVSGVTGACLLARLEVLEECGGLDEVNLTVAFNDVDLCLKIRERGYLIVWTPYAELYHLESASRGLDVASAKVERFNKEQAWMKDRWGAMLMNDPYYNPNLTLEKEDLSLAFPPRVSKPWRKPMTMTSKKKTEKVEAEDETKKVEADPRLNTGITILREPDDGAQEKTVIVLGLARSGTSMVAGTLYHLGVFMGDRFNNIVYEDRVLSSLVEAGLDEQVKHLIAARNERYSIWGWKRPSSLRFIGRLECCFRNPYYVVVFRDILSIANRNKISMLIDITQNMQQSVNQYSELLSFIEQSKAPCMLVSYDKAVASSETFVLELARFIGMRDGRAIESAINFIKPNCENYVEYSRITRSTGVLESVSETTVSGWVKSGQDPKRILDVQLVINHEKVQQAKANLLRSDLVEKGIHPTGICGFNFVLADDLRLKNNDEVRVKAIDDIHELMNSPYKYQVAQLSHATIGRRDVNARRECI